jgi:hypothetical protein
MKIRDGHGDFPVTAQSWPMFLFANHVRNGNDIEAGLFRSALLLKVIDTLLMR